MILDITALWKYDDGHRVHTPQCGGVRCGRPPAKPSRLRSFLSLCVHFYQAISAHTYQQPPHPQNPPTPYYQSTHPIYSQTQICLPVYLHTHKHIESEPTSRDQYFPCKHESRQWTIASIIAHSDIYQFPRGIVNKEQSSTTGHIW